MTLWVTKFESSLWRTRLCWWWSPPLPRYQWLFEMTSLLKPVGFWSAITHLYFFFLRLILRNLRHMLKKRGGIHLLSTWVTKKLMGLTYVHTNLSLPEKMAGPKRFQDRLPTYQLSGAFSVSFREDFPENVFYLRLFAVYAYAATHKLS